MEYIDYSGGGFQEAADEPAHPTQLHPNQQQQFVQPGHALLPDGTRTAYYGHAIPHPTSCDIKPRLTKEQHDVLENHYKQQPKPNTQTKKGFAEQLNVSLDKVNVCIVKGPSGRVANVK
jgi:hypothetical protein